MGTPPRVLPGPAELSPERAWGGQRWARSRQCLQSGWKGLVVGDSERKWPHSDWERPGERTRPGRAVPETQRLADNRARVGAGAGQGRDATFPRLCLRPASAPSVAARPAPLRAFSGTGPSFPRPHGTRQIRSGFPRSSQTQLLWGLGATLLSVPLPLCSPCQPLLPEISPA